MFVEVSSKGPVAFPHCALDLVPSFLVVVVVVAAVVARSDYVVVVINNDTVANAINDSSVEATTGSDTIFAFF